MGIQALEDVYILEIPQLTRCFLLSVVYKYSHPKGINLKEIKGRNDSKIGIFRQSYVSAVLADKIFYL